jgi:hypothetical protein
MYVCTSFAKDARFLAMGREQNSKRSEPAQTGARWLGEPTCVRLREKH